MLLQSLRIAYTGQRKALCCSQTGRTPTALTMEGWACAASRALQQGTSGWRCLVSQGRCAPGTLQVCPLALTKEHLALYVAAWPA